MKNIQILSIAFSLLAHIGCGDSVEINTSFKVNDGGSSQIISGPMIGHVSMRSIDVWAQVQSESNLSLKVWNEKAESISESIKVDSKTANSVVLKVGNLDPGTHYSAVVLSNGLAVGDTLNISTQL